MTSKLDKMGVGVLIGLFGGLVGFVIYGVYYSITHNVEFVDFVTRIFLKNKILRSPILSLSVLFNIIPFYFLLNRNYYKGARGVMAAIFIYAIAIVYYRFFS